MEKDPNSLILNVCILPSPEVAATAVQLSQSLGTEDTRFVLDGVTKFPHMTAYMARFSETEIPHVLEAVEKLVASAAAFSCEQSGYFITPGAYLEISYEKTPEFMSLHESLIDELKGYRNRPGEEIEENYYAPYTDEQRKNARETGYDLAHDLYRPHITLTRYQEGKTPEAMPTFPPVELSFTASTIGVFKADDNGAVYEKLGEFFIK